VEDELPDEVVEGGPQVVGRVSPMRMPQRLTSSSEGSPVARKRW
jgi:hypothetical protein